MSSTADRTVAPPVGAPAAWEYPASQLLPLAGAGGVRLVDLPGQPVLALEIVVPMPWVEEPREMEGLSVILAATLDEGTQEHDAESLARAFERAGVGLELSSTELGLMVGLECTPSHLDDALGLAAELLGRPTFPTEAVQREVRGRLFDIAQERATPSVRAMREFATLLHGEDTREGRPGAGSAQTVSAITAADVRAHHARWVRPDGAGVVLAGDLSGLGAPGEAVARVQQHLIDPWAAAVAGEGAAAGPEETVVGAEAAERSGAVGAAVEAGAGEAEAAQAGGGAVCEGVRRRIEVDGVETVVVHRSGAAQTEVRLGWLGPTRREPGGFHPYAPLAVHVGASPTSLLDEVLREEKGWTYGMRAAFRPRHRVGEFLVAGSFTTADTAPAVRELLRLLRGVPDGLDARAAAAARDYTLLTAPMRYATAETLAHEAAVLTLDGVGPEFSARTLGSLGETSAAEMADQMRAAWQRWAGGRWVMVLVGDADVWGEALGA
ncbi:Predicted Zn-dependent peptidase [Kytococcus aerolatus]|uniref:Predicted Zn-dependent peptidase n=1 Tax=Kytococcus aerolatus TaxID=592308 RepID=A0A212T7S2_9MICO|nr:insulinase family protein [Kytococcus aerolatus]SNC61891.1 Predicted Zn-dependent peptidase [Kytococcus aerolatus]